MNNKLALFFLVILMQFSCNNNDTRLADQLRDAKKKEVIFTNIKKGWNFFDTPINETSEATVKTWQQWREFMDELAKKPKKTIGDFQKKSKMLSTKVMALNTNIPAQFDTPQIRSRIATLITQVRMLDLYINLTDISDKKVVKLVAEINIELVSLQRQMDKIVEKSKIPMETGESELLQMIMDTTRAIPSGSPMMPGNPGNNGIPEKYHTMPSNPGGTASPKNPN
ncbi:hypothetical protein [Flavobacterium aquicola]|uniref:Uncharacterized protein n=1 Tax=Flavobacterium aquicola TaxID=1682742 RepID=A0A3E0ELF5_9FLAO|nr:hypothetical protein [Flavobacterium aquicola]REG99018.1 hypothetical protein C8P67_105183 [Flavobacterium aquicola]